MCGVIGMIDSSEAVYELATIGLMSLQHRGQDACGLVTDDDGFHVKKGLRPVHETLTPEAAAELPGRSALGHTRYATQGEARLEDAQPLITGGIALAQNGNLVNYFSLKRKLEERGVELSTTVDTELLLALFAEAYDGDFFAAAEAVLDGARGAYSIVGLLEGKGLFAIRDPRGIRPLVLGRNGSSYVVASETVALQAVGAEYVRDVAPGEALLISPDLGIESRRLREEEAAHCMFEWVYFASPNSMLEGRSVYKARLSLGKQAGRRLMTEDVDVVLPVPDSGRTAAIRLAESQRLRYREGLIRDRRTARTFIMASQRAREKAVGEKHRPIIATVQGKSVAVVDDSIVRGTTSKRIVQSLRKAGAEEVSFISTCPPIRHPCFYGIDFSTEKELIAHGRSEEEVRRHIDADTLVYTTVEDLERAIKRPLCTACLTGRYPAPLDPEERRRLQEQRTKAHGGATDGEA